MAFPASPVDQQLATINGIAYRYSTSNNTWTKVVTPASGNFDMETLTPNSVTSNFTLSRSAANASSILVIYAGVIQKPFESYTVSTTGKQLIFTEPPLTGQSLYVVYLGNRLDVPRSANTDVITDKLTANGVSSTFTLSQPPANSNCAIVFIDGIQQRSVNNFSISGNTVVFTSPPAASSEIDVYIVGTERASIPTVIDDTISTSKIQNSAVTRTKLAASLAKGIGAWSEISANTTAVAGGFYMANTVSTAITLTLPAGPTLGDTVRIVDAAGNFGTNNLTVAGNGSPIMSSNDPMTVSTANAAFELIFYNATYGWRLFTV